MSHEASAYGTLLGRMYFHGSDLLRQRAITRLTLTAPRVRKRILARLSFATALASGVVSTLCVALAQFNIGRLAERASQSLERDLVFVLFMGVPAAWLGMRATRAGALKGTNVSLFSQATGAGVVLSILCALVHALMVHGATRRALGAALATVCGGVLLSVPLGFLCGGMLRVAFGLRMSRVVSPTQDGPMRVSMASAAMLLLSAWCVSRFNTSVFELPLRTLTGITLGEDARTILLILPLVSCALILATTGLRELAVVQRARRAILRGTHPEYYPGDIAPGEDAIPLTEADRKSATKRLLVRRDASAYRGGEGSVQVYVGIA